MLRAMRVSLTWLMLAFGLGYSACSGESFKGAPEGEGAAGAGDAGAAPSSEGGNAAAEPSELAGAGGESAGAPAGGTSSAAAGAEAGGAGGAVLEPEPEYTESFLVDDMEDGDSQLLETNGYWYVLRDPSAGVITPPYGVPFTMTPLAPARDGSGWAAQVQVAGFQGWGAAFGFDFVSLNMQRQPYSLEDYVAVRFWARATKQTELKLQVPNADTDPYGNLCSGTEGENACYAHFTRAFTVGTEWREVTIPFRDLQQEGAGRRAESFDSQRVFSLFFVVGPKQELSVAVDDVRLVK